MRCLLRHGCLLLPLAFTLAYSRPACAKPPRIEDAKGTYWVGHSIAAGVLGAGAIISGLLTTEAKPLVSVSQKPRALVVAQTALTFELLAPPAAWAATSNGPEFTNAGLTYAQTLLLAMSVNHVLREATADSVSTIAFASAYVGSAMLDRQRPGLTHRRREVETEVRDAFWGIELGFATMAAHLEVRSGRRGYGSALLGVGLGTGIGVLAQVAHEERLRPSENWGYGLLAALPGIFIPLFISLPTPDTDQTAGLANLTLTPSFIAPGARGIALSGTF